MTEMHCETRVPGDFKAEARYGNWGSQGSKGPWIKLSVFVPLANPIHQSFAEEDITSH